MKRRKNLERAVVLGLLLSTSVYGSAWALITGDITVSDSGEEYYGDRIITGDTTAWAVDEAGIKIMTDGFFGEHDVNYIANFDRLRIDIEHDTNPLLGGNAFIAGIRTDADKKIANLTVNSTGLVEIKVASQNNYAVAGVWAQSEDTININSTKGDVVIAANKTNGTNLSYDAKSSDEANKLHAVYGINVSQNPNSAPQNGATVNITANDGSISVSANSTSTDLKGEHIYAAANDNGNVNLNAGQASTGGDITLKVDANNNNSAYGLDSYYGKQNNITAANNLVVSATSATGEAYAVKFIGGENNNFTGANNSFTAESTNEKTYALFAQEGAVVNVNAANTTDDVLDNSFTSIGGTAVQVENSKLTVTGDTLMSGTENGLVVKKDTNTFADGNEEYDVVIKGDLYAQAQNGYSSQLMAGTKLLVEGDKVINNTMSIEEGAAEKVNGNLVTANSDTGEYVTVNGNAVELKNNAELTVGGNVMVSGGQLGVFVDRGQLTVNGNSASSDANIITSSVGNALKVVEGTAKINAGDGANSIAAGETYKDGYVYFTGTAINATNESNGADLNTSIAAGGSKVDVLGSENKIGGTVRANGSDSIVNIGGAIDAGGKLSSGADNWITSSAHGVSTISNAGVVATVYAQNQATVNIKAGDGQTNYIIAQAGRLENGGKDYDERAVWAQGGSKVNIKGETIIGASKSEQIGIDENGNPTNIDFENLKENTGLGIAIAAGTGEISDESTLPSVPTGIGNSTVNLNYDGNSAIYGDIISAWNGLVNIKSDGTAAKLNVYGSALAGNGGVLNLDLGEGGVWYGRADDYGDAGSYNEKTNQYEGFYNPAFSNKVLESGEVNLTMGDRSKWYVQGQSWITSINTEGANDTLIDLVSANTNHNKTAHALTIGTLNGDTRFHMSLDANRDVSDMLYIKKANGSYQISLEDTVKADEIGANGLRFATVGAGSNVSFEVGSYDNGAFNVEYDVISETYSSTDEENKIYNSTEGGNASIEKPGSESVDNFFNPDNTKNKKQLKAANKIMLLAEDSSVNSTNNENTITEHTNFLLNGDVTKNLSDAGKTMLNMSRANYSNAIYMDRLNKRLGEARYINGEENEGMWVRIRHDRIGKEDAFRSQNTMYELGYDVKQECDNGERRVGFAVDYMYGDTGYSDVAGKGELDRYGLWLYDTWMGDKGHYVDYVAKWGHLDNDFEVYTMSKGDKVTGDYSNNVFSVSAEYGRKKDIGSDWYFEPQAQLQLARVTGAEYTTSQGTKVSVDGINSLIGRAGFRIGKDFGEQKQSTVYIKADVLHEFLGDQDVSVMDDTTNGRYVGIGYENEGTWYDVGFGFATQTGKNSYAFMDFEKSFGHDNDETYQINAGVRWTF